MPSSQTVYAARACKGGGGDGIMGKVVGSLFSQSVVLTHRN